MRGGTRELPRTSLCQLLGITYPILQSGMARVAGPELVAAVSDAGGLGIIAGFGLRGDQLRAQVRAVRALTDRPFGVNLWLHRELRPPVSPDSLFEATVAAVQEVLNGFRDRLGIPRSFARPHPTPDTIDEAFEALLEERVPVLATSVGLPDLGMTARCRERGIRVVAMAATVGDARAAAAAGADVVVAQGAEAGGHRSIGTRPATSEAARVGTMALVPQVVGAVRVPVVASGGIADGRGLAAALALGAHGVMLGTRFVATHESLAPPVWKEALLAADADATVVTEAFTGLPARALRNRFVTEYEASGAPLLPSLLQAAAAEDVWAAAAAVGDGEYFPLMAGQGVGLVRDVRGAGDVVRGLVREGEEVLARIAPSNG